MIPSSVEGAPTIAFVEGTAASGFLVQMSDARAVGWYEVHNNDVKFVRKLVDGVDSFATGDLDGDGDMDLVTASNRERQLTWYPNWDGVFPSRGIPIASGLSHARILLGDANSDGLADLFVATSSDDPDAEAVDLYVNRGGDFADPQRIVSEAVGIRTVQIADFNGDGRVDLLGTKRDASEVVFLANPRAPRAGWETTRVSKVDPFDSITTTVGDVDSDGDLDFLLAIVVGNESRVSWYDNAGCGDACTFHQVFGERHDVVELDTTVTSISLADLDGDDDNDIALGLYRTSKVVWHENEDGFGRFGPALVVGSDFRTGTHSVMPVDVDVDGDLDLVSAGVNERLAWFKNSSSRLNSFWEQRATSHVAPGPRGDLAIGDLDGDGDEDIVATSRANLVWYEDLDGNQQFSYPHVIDTDLRAHSKSVQLKDWDGDGDIDILTIPDGGRGSADQVLLYENSGEGSLLPPRVLADNVIHAVPVDFDSDGDLDLVVADVYSQIVWKEVEDGVVRRSRLLTKSQFGGTMQLADLDTDGDLDLLFHASEGYAWSENIDGAFGDRLRIIRLSGNTSSTHIVDVDSDGDLDVVHLGSEIVDRGAVVDGLFLHHGRAVPFHRWLENTDGSGEFVRRHLPDEFPRWAESAVGDLDADGDIDIVSGGFWSPNDSGVQRFPRVEEINDRIQGRIALSDLDRDGDLDVIALVNAYDRIVWHESDFPTSPIDPIRINAGGSDFVDASGSLWMADRDFRGGFSYSTNADIRETEDDGLFRTERAGTFSYSIPVDNGTYRVDLQMAEIFFSDAGERVFDVFAEDNHVVDGLDLITTVGERDTAMTVTLPSIAVTDQQLDLRFSASVNNAKVAGIRVSPSAHGEPIVSFAGSRSASGERDNSAVIELRRFGSLEAASDVVVSASWPDRVEELSVRFSPKESTKQITIAIKDDGLAEPTETVQLRITGGANMTLGDRPIHYLRIVDDDGLAELRINAGSEVDFRDASGLLWKSDRYFANGASEADPIEIGDTIDDALYQTARRDRELAYRMPIANGVVDVELRFSDNQEFGWRAGFDIYAQDQLVAENLSIFRQSGGAARAWNVTIPNIEVTEGELTLHFVGPEARVAAIAVTHPEPTHSKRLPGDADLNGSVEFTDFLLLAKNFGQHGVWGDGDFDGNGVVGFSDFLILSQNFDRP